MMSVEPALLDVALAAAVGDDPALMADLRAAFVAGVTAHVEAIARAGALPARQAAAWRLHGLAASFGAVDLMELASEVARAPAADPRLTARLHRALAEMAG